MKQIRLSTGNFVIVDDEDYEKLSSISWSENRTAISKTSYAHARIEGIPTYMHRLITAAPKGSIVDHINHNGLDNRKENLRVVDSTTNMYNRREKDHSSQYFGVFKQKGRNRYRAVIKDKLLGRIYIGSYESEEDAARAYNDYVKMFGYTSCPLNILKGEEE